MAESGGLPGGPDSGKVLTMVGRVRVVVLASVMACAPVSLVLGQDAEPEREPAMRAPSAGQPSSMRPGRGPAKEDAPERVIPDPSREEIVAGVLAGSFDPAWLSSLTSWSGGEAWTEEAIDGRVLVLAFWNADDIRSARAMPALSRLERRFDDEPLAVVGVHGAEAWERAQELVSAGRVQSPVALDAEGAMAKAFAVEDVPTVVVVDRAGQVRAMTDRLGDLPKLASELIRETPEEAMATRAERVAAYEKMKSARESGEGATAEAPVKKEVRVPASAYAGVAWPALNDPRRVSGLDVQGRKLPVAFNPGSQEKWLSEPFEDLENRIVVLDFWGTWCGPCIAASPILDAVQKRYPEQVAVIAVGGQRDTEAEVAAYIREHKTEYRHVFDEQQRVYRGLRIRGIPHTVVMSTDGVVRWQGHPADPAFLEAIEKLVEVDPRLKALREG